MILYYTGASSDSQDQNNSSASLGGYVSATTISNGLLNAIFSTVSKSIVVGNKRDTRCVALRNLTGSTIYNVKIWIDNTVDNCHSTYLAAAMSAALDNCNNPYFEQISSSEAVPYQCTLVSANGQEEAIEVGTLNSGDVIGIWISKNVIAADFPTANGATNGTSDAAILALQNSIANPITQDNVNLVINWDTNQTTTTTTTLAPTTTTSTTAP